MCVNIVHVWTANVLQSPLKYFPLILSKVLTRKNSHECNAGTENEVSFDIKPPEVSFDIKPPEVSFDIKPPEVSFDIKPTEVSFDIKPPEVSFDIKPTEVSFDIKPF